MDKTVVIKGEQSKEIKNFSTKDLVYELMTRMGVDSFDLSSYSGATIKVEGQVMVLVVNDWKFDDADLNLQ